MHRQPTEATVENLDDSRFFNNARPRAFPSSGADESRREFLF